MAEEQENQEEVEQQEEQKQQEQEAQEQMQNMFQSQKKQQEKKDKERFKKIFLSGCKRWFPWLTPSEKMFVEKYKRKYKKEENRVMMFEDIMKNRQQMFKDKVKNITTSAGSSGVAIAGVIFIFVIVFGVIFATLYAFKMGDGSDRAANSAFGAKGDSFQGTRMVYRDEEQAKNTIFKQYVSIVSATLNNIKDNIKTDTVYNGEEDVVYDVEISISIPMPDENFDFKELDLEKFNTDYPELYSAVEDIAKVVYKEDFPEGTATAIDEILKEIPYFGFNADMVGSVEAFDDDATKDNNIMEVVYDLIKQSGVLEIKEKIKEETTAEYAPATNVTLETLDEEILNEVKKIDAEHNKKRVEKLFIQDNIFTKEDQYTEGIKDREYVAFIYLAKNNQPVTISYFAYNVIVQGSVDVEVNLFNGEKSISINKGAAEDFGDGDMSYMHSSSENLSESLTDYSLIDYNNLEMFKEETSLYDVLVKTSENSSDFNLYLKQETNEKSEEYLTVKMAGIYATFESDGVFLFTEEISY